MENGGSKMAIYHPPSSILDEGFGDFSR